MYPPLPELPGTAAGFRTPTATIPRRMTAAGTRAPRTVRARTPYDVIALVLLAYVPFLLSSRGQVSSDTKQYLYLDPGRFLARVPWLWDPHVAAGTVPHQQLG
jgi:arabinofuranan 3-O-arabinosyltransferase